MTEREKLFRRNKEMESKEVETGNDTRCGLSIFRASRKGGGYDSNELLLDVENGDIYTTLIRRMKFQLRRLSLSKSCVV